VEIDIVFPSVVVVGMFGSSADQLASRLCYFDNLRMYTEVLAGVSAAVKYIISDPLDIGHIFGRVSKKCRGFIG